MLVLKARNANQAVVEMAHLLTTSDQISKESSRNGPVYRFLSPVTIEYSLPEERVVFWPQRDANPFFHLFESLWMLGGRNDVAYPSQFNSTFGQFSDDGVTFHGAYGHRWRRHFGMDQMKSICDALRKDPTDRRQVLQMWDANVDGNGRQGKDFPCNLIAVFNIAAGRLNMTVYNRSNDAVWGALGANCVHFSVLQEFMARRIGVPLGKYWQVSANMHAYEATAGKVLELVEIAFPSTQYKEQDPYEADLVDAAPIVNTHDTDSWLQQNDMFLDEGDRAIGYKDPFFRRLAIPMLRAYRAFSNRDDANRFGAANEELDKAMDCDWKLACQAWLNRRELAAHRKAEQAKASQTKDGAD